MSFNKKLIVQQSEDALKQLILNLRLPLSVQRLFFRI